MKEVGRDPLGSEDRDILFRRVHSKRGGSVLGSDRDQTIVLNRYQNDQQMCTFYQNSTVRLAPAALAIEKTGQI
jgi:hypothetical protein